MPQNFGKARCPSLNTELQQCCSKLNTRGNHEIDL